MNPQTSADAHAGSPRMRAARRRVTSASLLSVAMVLILITGLIAAVHLDDRYRIDAASGARIALARYFDEGTLYPPLFDGEHFGGTRFMPLPLVLHGVAGGISNNYLVSGKTIALGTMIGLIIMLLYVLRRQRCSWPLTLGLSTLVLATRTGLGATMSLRADSLPLLLQVTSLALIMDDGSRRRDVAAGAVAALALMGKFSAVWAPIGIVMHLMLIDRQRAKRFGFSYLATLILMMSGFVIVTEGRLLENVLGLAGAGVTGLHDVLVAPYRAVTLTVQEALPVVVLVPVVLLLVGIAIRERRSSLPIWCLAAYGTVLLVVLSDIGTGWNQLVDLPVLVALVLGEATRTTEVEPLFARIIAVSVVFAGGLGLVVTIVPETIDAARTVRDPMRYSATPIDGSARNILSEDPYVPVSLGRNPVVLDPFMLPRLAPREPGAIDALIERIEGGDFDLVVLSESLSPPDKEWWARYHFGTEVTGALARAYTFEGRRQGYFLYRPAVNQAQR